MSDKDLFDIFVLKAHSSNHSSLWRPYMCSAGLFGTSHPANNTRAEVAFMKLRCGCSWCVWWWWGAAADSHRQEDRQ